MTLLLRTSTISPGLPVTASYTNTVHVPNIGLRSLLFIYPTNNMIYKLMYAEPLHKVQTIYVNLEGYSPHINEQQQVEIMTSLISLKHRENS